MDNHEDCVREIAKEIAAFYRTSIPFRIYHGSTNSTRPSSRTYKNTVDISQLNNILLINSSAKTCLVEPNVPMDALVAAVLKHNLIPPVVPEFPGITVGGAFAGTAGESSSFRYGFFEDCVNWVEIILANGDVVTASEHENVELFLGSKGTFGTLGVGTLFEIRLVESKQFVQVRYETVSKGIEEAKLIMERECTRKEQHVDFIDGIMFSKDSGVIVLGQMADKSTRHESDGSEEDLPVITFSRASDPWFYLHAQDVMLARLGNVSQKSKTPPYTELIPLEDYLFRYDRGAFWTGRYAFKYFCTPFTHVTRWILDSFMRTRTMYHALHRSGLIQQFIIQDMAVPWNRITPFFEWLDEKLEIYPLWLAPLRLGNGGIRFSPKFASASRTSGELSSFVLNLGVWGVYPGDPLTINREIEAKLRELRGMKWLYSQTFYTEDEFWSIYDRDWYTKLRRTYHAQTLPDVYEKVGGTALNQHNVLTGVWKIWPLAGVYGVLSTLKGGDYLRKG